MWALLSCEVRTAHFPLSLLIQSLFGRAPAGASAPAPAGAMPNACFGKGSAWGAGQEPEPFFACAGEASKTSFARLLAVGSRRLVRRSCFAKRFPERLQLLQRSCSFRGARAGAIFRGARALPNRPLMLERFPISFCFFNY